MAHAETVFFIDNHEAEVFKSDVGLHQFMRADYDIHRAIGHAFERLLGGFAGVETGKLRHFHRKVGEAVGEVLRMLLHQQGGGREHAHLFAAHHRHKGRAQGHFGFAEAHIAAHEPVHRLALGEVFEHRADGGGLVFGFFIAEAV